VAIVDDHPMFRMGLAVAIAEMAGIEVAGEAECADEVAGLVASTAPDVLLLDVRLGDGSGLEVNRWLAAYHPGIKVIMLTMSEDHDTALTALRDGASGYLVKGAGPERLEHALRAAAAGDVVLDHDMAKAVTELALTRRRGAAGRPFAELTQREFDILELVAEGLDNQAIARRLVLSPKTVRNHVSNVLTKLNVADRSHAIVLSRQRGLGQGAD
jgi:DNA-binding NarL/FixJ family response regulator